MRRVVDARDISGIETAIAQFARQPNGGLIVTSSGIAIANRDRIIAAATSHRLPSVYANHFWADGGGLISYGSDINEQYRRAADYVDRIFKGEKPADLPVQSRRPNTNLIINLNTAKSLGIAVPQTLLARADKVIE